MIQTAAAIQQRVSWPYIEFDEQARAVLTNTRMRISFLVQERDVHGWSPEEIYFQHSDLSLAQIYAAFSYYYDHQEEIDHEIRVENTMIEQIRKELIQAGAGYDAETFKTLLETPAEQV